MAATYARTVATGPAGLRTGTVGRGEGATVCCAWGVPLPSVWRSVTTRFVAAGGALAECGERGRKLYATKPIVTASARPSTVVRFGRRRPGVWTGVASSSRLTAESGPGA